MTTRRSRVACCLYPGFDTLGLALSVYDELMITALEASRLEIEVRGSGGVPAMLSSVVINLCKAARITPCSICPVLPMTMAAAQY